MASFKLDFKPSVRKDLHRLSKPVIARLLKRIEELKMEPHPRQAVKLTGAERLYRIRVGAYRIVYEINASEKEIIIHYVRHRREAYRGL